MWQKIKNYYHLSQAFLAAAYYNFPSKEIKVIGVTGTDGKTTTVHMIYEILTKSGLKASYISSLHAAIGSKIFRTGFHVTTPSAWQIQRFLRQAVNANHKFFVLEATSHGLDQHRLSFINFEVGVLTNITHEHLDYHKTWENYATAKLMLLKKSKFRVLNLDDEPSYKFMNKYITSNVTLYGLEKNADTNLTNSPLKLQIEGDYNLFNALSALSVAKILGINTTKALRILNKFQGVEGRMQKVDLGQNFTVYIDFAHTPNALKAALSTLKDEANLKKGNVIAVFGAAGLRDKSKRPLMGSVADELADIIILTAEDPRTEPIAQINSEIQKGIKNKTLGRNLFVMDNRAQAIDYAISLASENSIVGLFGKGHEKSLCFGKTETAWSEFDEAKKPSKEK